MIFQIILLDMYFSFFYAFFNYLFVALKPVYRVPLNWFIKIRGVTILLKIVKNVPISTVRKMHSMGVRDTERAKLKNCFK